ncbi:DUF2783 domain-containing protein [soil metagenome]
MPPDISTLRLSDADGFYEALLRGHETLDARQGALLNAKLVMLLANQVGDLAGLQACIDAAREDIAT